MSKKKLTNIKFIDTAEKEQKLLAVFEQNKDVEGALMAILQQAQDIYGYLPIEIMKKIASFLDKPVEEVYSVATFYTQFRLSPQGQYRISLCLGTVCYIKGAGDILNEIKNLLGIEPGECTSDGKFSLDTTRCLGCCGLAPVMAINDKIYGNVKVKDIKDILDNCR
ncbi:MAG: NAD(P)H-dependent oxidoreductase subunit E [Bacilli bacterium]|nr:NAD(P)H-dependent oxidoreductase subunit E [Bacilli bacterium]